MPGNTHTHIRIRHPHSHSVPGSGVLIMRRIVSEFPVTSLLDLNWVSTISSTSSHRADWYKHEAICKHYWRRVAVCTRQTRNAPRPRDSHAPEFGSFSSLLLIPINQIQRFLFSFFFYWLIQIDVVLFQCVCLQVAMLHCCLILTSITIIMWILLQHGYTSYHMIVWDSTDIFDSIENVTVFSVDAKGGWNICEFGDCVSVYWLTDFVAESRRIEVLC